jgi:hypothetical protein
MVRSTTPDSSKSRRAGYPCALVTHRQLSQASCLWHPSTASGLNRNHPAARVFVEEPKGCCPKSQSDREKPRDLNEPVGARLL